MVNEQIMIDTVRRMLEAGIDDATVISTLTDAGLTNEQCLEIISKVKEPQNAPQPVMEQSPTQDVAVLRNVVEAQGTAQEMHAETTSTVLDDHEQKIAKVSEKVDSLQSTISSSNTKQSGSLEYRLSELEKKLEDVNSASKAQLDLMQKILETNRRVLTELEAKK